MSTTSASSTNDVSMPALAAGWFNVVVDGDRLEQRAVSMPALAAGWFNARTQWQDCVNRELFPCPPWRRAGST